MFGIDSLLLEWAVSCPTPPPGLSDSHSTSAKPVRRNLCLEGQ